MSFVNLLPEDYVAKQSQKRANLVCSLLFVVVVAGVLTAAVVSNRNHKRTQEVCERVNQSYNEAGKLIQQMQELDAAKRKMLKKAKLTAGLLERVPRSYILATIANALPKGASLTQFELTTERKRAPSVSKGKGKSRYKAAAKKKAAGTPQPPAKMEVAITVTGLAGTDVQVARFITLMARCPLIEVVDLVYSKEKKILARHPETTGLPANRKQKRRQAGKAGENDTIVREFQVILRLKADADVRGSSAVAAEAGPAVQGDNKRQT